MFNGKKADERMLSFYWIIIFVLIAVAVVGATILFFKSPFDARQVEARILGDKITECISDRGQLVKEAKNRLDSDGSNLEAHCDLVLDDQFYIKIAIQGRPDIVFIEGASGNLAALCGGQLKAQNMPACYQRKIMLLDEEDAEEFVLVEINLAINKVVQNVK